MAAQDNYPQEEEEEEVGAHERGKYCSKIILSEKRPTDWLNDNKQKFWNMRLRWDLVGRERTLTLVDFVINYRNESRRGMGGWICVAIYNERGSRAVLWYEIYEDEWIYLQILKYRWDFLLQLVRFWRSPIGSGHAWDFYFIISAILSKSEITLENGIHFELLLCSARITTRRKMIFVPRKNLECMHATIFVK